MTHYLELTPIDENIQIVGKDKNWNNFTFIKSVQTGTNIHHGNGFEYTFAIEDHHELTINFHGPKPSAHISSL